MVATMSAAAYYSKSLSDKLFDRELVGRDDAGRKVYQKSLSGKPYGCPRALLTWAEYKRHTAQTCPHVGVDRWCPPYFRNDAPAWCS